jgi:hypothetical protein
MPMLTKPCPQTSSSFPNIKHATFTTRDAVDEKEGAREMVLDMVLRFNYLCNLACFIFGKLDDF